MKKSLLILAIPVILGSTNYAWWVTFKHEPREVAYDGKFAKEYGKNFSHIEIYSCENSQFFTKDQCGEIERNGASLQVVADSNDGGKNEVWKIGVAKNIDGKFPYSNVLLAVDEVTGKLLQVLSIDTEGSTFSVLIQKENELSLFFCLECGDYAEIIWSGAKWEVAWPEPYGLTLTK